MTLDQLQKGHIMHRVRPRISTSRDVEMTASQRQFPSDNADPLHGPHQIPLQFHAPPILTTAIGLWRVHVTQNEIPSSPGDLFFRLHSPPGRVGIESRKSHCQVPVRATDSREAFASASASFRSRGHISSSIVFVAWFFFPFPLCRKRPQDDLVALESTPPSLQPLLPCPKTTAMLCSAPTAKHLPELTEIEELRASAGLLPTKPPSSEASARVSSSASARTPPLKLKLGSAPPRPCRRVTAPIQQRAT